MRAVAAGDREVDRCMTCGALWFDAGEIRELTEGRVPLGCEEAQADGGTAAQPPGRPAAAGSPGNDAAAPRKPDAAAPAGQARGVLLKLHRQARGLSCPRCGGKLLAIDFQTTGIPVFLCLGCRGYLAPRDSAASIDARFRYIRAHNGEYEALGEAIAGEFRRGMEERGEIPRHAARPEIPLPIFVPLADDGPAPESFPYVTYLLIALSVALFLYFRISDAVLRLPGGTPGLPSGSGVGAVPAAAILASPFLHAGLVPLLAGALFLFVLGDNVEDRIGPAPYLALYVVCGAAAGIAHIAWGEPGHPAALGSAGAVAGVLGAYLIFFPQVSIKMYGLGRVASVPAYLFACAWLVAAILIGPGLFTNFINPAPFSLAGNIGGFGAGVCCAVFWRFLEDAARPSGSS